CPLIGQHFVWEKIYGGTQRDFAHEVVQTVDGGFIIGGLSYSFGPTSDIYLIKTDMNGDLEWQKVFDYNQQMDGAYSVKQTPDKGYILAGTTKSAGFTPYDAYIVKTDQSGNFLWNKVFGLSNADEEIFDIEHTPDCGYIMVGYKKYYQQYARIYIVRMEAQGNIIWEKEYGCNAGHSVGYAIEVDYDGYVITGYTYCIGGIKKTYLLKIDWNGNIIWWKDLGPELYGAVAYDLKKTNDEGYIVCGIIPGSPEPVFLPPYEPYLVLEPPDAFLAKTNHNGDIEWVKFYGWPLVDDYFLSVQQTADGGYVAGGHTNYYTAPNPPFNAWIVKTDEEGNEEWYYIHPYHQYGTYIVQARDGTYNLTGGKYNPSSEYDAYLLRIYGNILYTDDSKGLAYNANRHLVYGNNYLHMIFTSGKKIYYSNSSDGGFSWSLPPSELGEGKFPAIALDAQRRPHCCWTDEVGGLWYISPQLQLYHLYDPWAYWMPRLTSPPSICVTPDDTVHILTNLYTPANNVMNAIVEWSFPLQNPNMINTRIIEDATYLLPNKVEYPSIAYSIDPSPPTNGNIVLHAAWQHGDTIYYATRRVCENWNIWTWNMWPDSNRINSSHPFVETYGDQVFLVWSHKTGINNLEDIYKASRHLHGYFSPSVNISQSPASISIYPVNSYGPYTLYTEIPWPQMDEASDIFLNGSNISNTPSIRSIFSHSALKRRTSGDYLYVIWLEGNVPPYEIKFVTLSMGTQYQTPYITSIAGSEIPSPYLIQRDTFFSNWQIPVDAGINTVKYKFHLEPGYKYKMKVIAYFEGNGEWREWIKIDGKMKKLIKYKAYIPESLSIWIPPAFYKDGEIEVSFEKIRGDYAISGPIYIYQYEYEEFKEYQEFNYTELTINEKKNSGIFLPLDKEFKIFSIDGRLIIDKDNNSKIFRFKDLGPGIYILKTKEKDKWVYKKFIKF
ncbi:MAG: T9SS type A sorting domain-containing protein, partial [Thermoplasmata archaeon]